MIYAHDWAIPFAGWRSSIMDLQNIAFTLLGNAKSTSLLRVHVSFRCVAVDSNFAGERKGISTIISILLRDLVS